MGRWVSKFKKDGPTMPVTMLMTNELPLTVLDREIFDATAPLTTTCAASTTPSISAQSEPSCSPLIIRPWGAPRTSRWCS